MSFGFGPGKDEHDHDHSEDDHHRREFASKMDDKTKPTHDKEDSSDGDDSSSEEGDGKHEATTPVTKYYKEHHITTHYRGSLQDLLGSPGKEVKMSSVFPVAFDTEPHTRRQIGGDFTRSVPYSGSITSMTNTYPFAVGIRIPGFGSDVPHGYAAVIGPGRTRDFAFDEAALTPIPTSSRETWSAEDLQGHYTGSLNDPVVSLKTSSSGDIQNPIARWLLDNGKDHPIIATPFQKKMFRSKSDKSVKSEHVAIAVKALDTIHKSIPNKPVDATPDKFAMTVVALPVDGKTKTTDYAATDGRYGVTVQAKLAYVPTRALEAGTDA